MRLPGSPIVARPDAGNGREHALPKTYETPRPDPNVAPKPRGNRSQEGPKPHTVNRIPLDQPQPQHQPKAERQDPQPQRQPKAEQQPPQRQPKAEQQPPQRQPKAEQRPPQRQPKAERQNPQPRGRDSAGSKPDQDKGKGKK